MRGKCHWCQSHGVSQEILQFYCSAIKRSATFFLAAGSSENQVLPISYLLVQESLQRLGKVRACEIILFFSPCHDI